MEAMRQTWTDDRMDDLVKRVDDGFAHVDQRFEQFGQQVDQRFKQVDQRFEQTDRKIDQVHEDCRELRRQMTALGVELRGELKTTRVESRAETKALEASMNQRFNGFDRRFDMITATLVTGFVGLIVSNFL